MAGAFVVPKGGEERREGGCERCVDMRWDERWDMRWDICYVSGGVGGH